MGMPALNRGAFFATVRNRLGTLSQSQVDGLTAVLDAVEHAQLPLSHGAYVLATPWWETNKTMQPVREAYYISKTFEGAEAWRKAHLRYYPWYGRGFVQLTWDFNYQKADDECAAAGLIKSGEIMANPDLVMCPDIAALILVDGMRKGWFTGASLGKCLPPHGVATRDEYMRARTIINGHDKADEIEDFAQVFERALRDGGWA